MGLRPWSWHGGGQLLALVRIRRCILNLSMQASSNFSVGQLARRVYEESGVFGF